MRVLIVSPHFPPTNAADMQRVRLVLPYLRDNGVEATVLAVDSEQVAAPVDTWLLKQLPTNVAAIRVKAIGLKWRSVPGFGSLTRRALGALRAAGNKELLQRRYDLIYFSTTQFGVLTLGPYWRRRFGVGYVVDYQDPWVSDYYRLHPDVCPPGGRIKYAAARLISRYEEPMVLKRCGGATAVSKAYIDQIRSRYMFVPPDWPTLIIPFPGDGRDLRLVSEDPEIRQSIFDPSDGYRHWVYVGRGGADMRHAVRALFCALAKYRLEQSHVVDRLRLHFVGTSYAAAGMGTKTIEPIAAEYGLSDIVSEHTDRIAYSQTLRCLLDASALVVPGSDDASYTASKLYPYLLARQPLLAVFHEESSVRSVMDSVGGGVFVGFKSTSAIDKTAAKILTEWLIPQRFQASEPFDENAFWGYSAEHQAKALSDFWRDIIGTGELSGAKRDARRKMGGSERAYPTSECESADH